MLGQKIHGLRHLFQVEHLGPAGISGTFPGLEFCLDVYQQIDLRWGGLHSGFLPRRMLFLTGEDRQQIVQSVAFTQAVQPGHFVPAGQL